MTSIDSRQSFPIDDSATRFRLHPRGLFHADRSRSRSLGLRLQITGSNCRATAETAHACRFQRRAVNSGKPHVPSRSVTVNPCLAALEGAFYLGSISRLQSSFGTTPLPIRSPPRKGLVERLPQDKLQIEAHPRQEILHSSPRNSDFFSKFGQSYIPTFGHDDFASRIRKPHPSERLTAERGIPTAGSSKRLTKVRGL